MTTQLSIDRIRTDGGTQPRTVLDSTAITAYAEDMQDGAVFPPIVVFYDGTDYWLADGFHRVRAARQLGLTEIATDVRQGTVEDARWFSYGVNKDHGLRRTNEDKRRAVEAALAHPYASQKSLREIAGHCGVHWTTVENYRRTSVENLQIDTRLVTRNGSTYVMNTAKIGQQTESDPLHDLPLPFEGEPVSLGVARQIANSYKEPTSPLVIISPEDIAPLIRIASPDEDVSPDLPMQLPEPALQPPAPPVVRSTEDYADFYGDEETPQVSTVTAEEESELRFDPATEEALCRMCTYLHREWVLERPGVWRCLRCGGVTEDTKMGIAEEPEPETLNYGEQVPANLIRLPTILPQVVVTPEPTPEPTPALQSSPMAVHFSSDSSEWYTPAHILERVRLVLGEIDLDPASSALANQTVGATRFYTLAEDGLISPWFGRVYMNPPYGDVIGQWTARLKECYEKGEIESAIALVPGRIDTAWFHALVKGCTWCAPRGRLRFSNADNSAPFPSAIVYLGDDIETFKAHFDGLGQFHQVV